MSTLPSPVAVWSEQSGAGGLLTRMAPFLTSAGYWVFLPATPVTPTGYTRGALVPTAAGLNMLTTVPTTSGRSITKSPSGMLFFYSTPPLGWYVAGDSLGTATFTRASVATYTASVPDLMLRYLAGDFLGAATFTRASVATYTASV